MPTHVNINAESEATVVIVFKPEDCTVTRPVELLTIR